MTDQEKRLLQLFARLAQAERETVVAFAEFLCARIEPDGVSIPEPRRLPRPEQETVIGALKRLSASYPMLDKAKMLNETSGIVAQHVLQGRSAQDVIDNLEHVFQSQYERLQEEAKK